MRKSFTEMLDWKHTETMRKYSQFQTAEDENDAYEMWRERRERESKCTCGNGMAGPTRVISTRGIFHLKHHRPEG